MTGGGGVRNKLKKWGHLRKGFSEKGVPPQLCGNISSALFSFILIILPESGKIKKKPKQLLSTQPKNRCIAGPRKGGKKRIWERWYRGWCAITFTEYPGASVQSWWRTHAIHMTLVGAGKRLGGHGKFQFFFPTFMGIQSFCYSAAIAVVYLISSLDLLYIFPTVIPQRFKKKKIPSSERGSLLYAEAVVCRAVTSLNLSTWCPPAYPDSVLGCK